MGSGFVVDHRNPIDATRPGHYGAADAGVTIAETTIVAAWNVQGDPARASFVDEVGRALDIALPTLPNAIAVSANLTAIWLGPRSWLLASVGASSLVDYIQKRDAINAAGGALFDITAGRVAWTVSGPRATDVLAKGCPLDFHPRAFSAGTCAQSLLGHVNALFIKHDDAPTFTVMVARSFAREVLHALVESAAQYGCDVQPPER
jgi:sarcosine oxidase subunit gamma